MYNRILSSIASRTGISAIRGVFDSRRLELEQLRIEVGELGKQLSGLQAVVQALQQSQANQESRAAGWHADMINRQRKFEDMLVRLGSRHSTERSDRAVSSRSGAAGTEIQQAAPFDRATSSDRATQ